MPNSEESCSFHLQAAISSIDGSIRFDNGLGLNLFNLLLPWVPAQYVSIYSFESHKLCGLSVDLRYEPDALGHSSLMQEP